ncbi:hypothetical protein COV20_02120 [Candidatus Woesearchaeota archaeon CG10_big_fil_rev_8_21_14_0_10_45_16]|nr:MAG: hypothetical protein COV20_02120 [Candidatus Woesearchaeota archaeon CG10_big_fil_rev_8_21_14_0_10_45_16]
MQQKIFDMLLEEEEISWKNILYDLVKSEQMDPWDINITLLTQKYIEVIKEMQVHDLRVSGKIILAAAVLLKLKCNHLLDKDISRLDALMNPAEDLEDLEDEMFLGVEGHPRGDKEQYKLIPRNPQPRNRKVSIHDLVNALQHALITKKRVLEKIKPVHFNMPERKIDIMEVIRDVYHKIQYYSDKDKTDNITFTRLLPPRAGRQEKVYTFLPLLHLENQKRINMQQPEAFSEINVRLLRKDHKNA